MSFLYPRVVSISRPIITAPTDVGNVGENAVSSPADYDVVASGLRASIQLDRQGQRNPVGLPTDAAYKPVWKIFIPLPDAALGSIFANDVVTDDIGNQYQVFAPYWDSLGFNLRCIILEV